MIFIPTANISISKMQINFDNDQNLVDKLKHKCRHRREEGRLSETAASLEEWRRRLMVFKLIIISITII